MHHHMIMRPTGRCIGRCGTWHGLQDQKGRQSTRMVTQVVMYTECDDSRGPLHTHTHTHTKGVCEERSRDRKGATLN